MLKIARNLAFVALAAPMTLLAADPFIGTWKMNPAKSKYSPGPAPKSATLTYTQDGDWIVGKNDTVGADGAATTATNRYKRDGKDYPFRTANGDSGTTTVKALDANTAQATLKIGASTTTLRTVISQDGKSFTRTTKGPMPTGGKSITWQCTKSIEPAEKRRNRHTADSMAVLVAEPVFQ